jgi:hypothetical protein
MTGCGANFFVIYLEFKKSRYICSESTGCVDGTGMSAEVVAIWCFCSERTELILAGAVMRSASDQLQSVFIIIFKGTKG